MKVDVYLFPELERNWRFRPRPLIIIYPDLQEYFFIKIRLLQFSFWSGISPESFKYPFLRLERNWRFRPRPLIIIYLDFQEVFLCWNLVSAVDSNRDIFLWLIWRLIRRLFRWVEAQGLLRHQTLCYLLQQKFAVRDI